MIITKGEGKKRISSLGGEKESMVSIYFSQELKPKRLFKDFITFVECVDLW